MWLIKCVVKLNVCAKPHYSYTRPLSANCVTQVTNNKRIKQEKSGLFYEKSISMHRHLTASSIQFTG